MKAILWHDETMGADYSVEEIPANLVDEANEWREKMLETVAEFDDALMEKFLDDPSTITEEEILRALRAGTLKMCIRDSNDSSQQRKNEALKRLQVVESFRASRGRNKPEWMIVRIVPRCV